MGMILKKKSSNVEAWERVSIKNESPIALTHGLDNSGPKKKPFNASSIISVAWRLRHPWVEMEASLFSVVNDGKDLYPLRR